MKTKKFAAVLAGAAILAATVAPLAACGNSNGKSLGKTKDIEPLNYAVERPSADSQNGYTELRKTFELAEGEIIVTDYNTVGSYASGDVKIIKYTNGSDTLYKVYNFRLSKIVLNGLKGAVYNNASSYYRGVSEYIRVKENSQAAYYATDGTQLLPAANYNGLPAFETAQYYLGNDTEASTVLKVTAVKPTQLLTSTEEVIKYFKVTQDETTGAYAYQEAAESTINFVHIDEDATVGADRNGLKEPIYPSDEDRPVSGEIKDYSYSQLGDVYTYYKNGEKTGSVTVKDGGVLGYIDNVMYYYELTPVDVMATKGYNLIMTTGISSMKFNYSLHSYDVLKNKTKNLNYNVVILNISAMYNYEAESYDAALISGYEKKDGVAYVAYGGEVDYDFNYIVDKNLKVGYDLVQYGSSAPNAAIYLGDSKYLLFGFGNYSFAADADLNIINTLSASTVYTAENLISFTSNGYCGFTDLSGKVVIPAKYSANGTLRFYDGYACVNELQPDGTLKKALLKADGTVSYLPEEVNSGSHSVTVTVMSGYYCVCESTQPLNGAATVTYAYYNFAGELLKKFDGNVTASTVAGSTYIVENTGSTTAYYKLIQRGTVSNPDNV